MFSLELLSGQGYRGRTSEINPIDWTFVANIIRADSKIHIGPRKIKSKIYDYEIGFQNKNNMWKSTKSKFWILTKTYRDIIPIKAYKIINYIMLGEFWNLGVIELFKLDYWPALTFRAWISPKPFLEHLRLQVQRVIHQS